MLERNAKILEKYIYDTDRAIQAILKCLKENNKRMYQ